MEDGFPDTLPAGVCCVLGTPLGVALFPVVPVSCCVVITASDKVVIVGVVGLDKSTLTGVKADCVGFSTICWQDWPPLEATEAQICAFCISRVIGTITVMGIFNVVLFTLIS